MDKFRTDDARELAGCHPGDLFDNFSAVEGLLDTLSDTLDEVDRLRALCGTRERETQKALAERDAALSRLDGLESLAEKADFIATLFGVVAPPETWTTIECRAHAAGVPASEWVRRALLDALDRTRPAGQ